MSTRAASSPPAARNLAPVTWVIIGGACVGLAAAAVLQPLTTIAVAILALGTAIMAVLPLSWLLPALIFTVPFRFYFAVPGMEAEVSATTLLVVALGGAWLTRLLFSGPLRLRSWEWVIVGFWAWTVLSLLWSVQRATSLRGAVQWTYVATAILLSASAILRSADPARVARRLLQSLLALIAVWSVFGFVEVAIGLPALLRFFNSPLAATFFPPRFLEGKITLMSFNWLSDEDVQPFGPFVNSIEFGIFTAVGLSIVAAASIGRTRLLSLAGLLSAGLLSATANVAALKATGWSAAAAAITLAFLAFGRSVKRVLLTALGCALMIGLLAFVFQDVLVRRLEELAVREGARGATAQAISRPVTWAEYMKTAVARPVTGFGTFTSSINGPTRWTYLPGTSTQVAYQVPTENGYLSTVIDTGFVGLVGLLLTFGGAMVRGAWLSRRHPGSELGQTAGLAAVGLCAIMAGNMTVDGFAGDVVGFITGTLTGIVIAAVRLVPVAREST